MDELTVVRFHITKEACVYISKQKKLKIGLPNIVVITEHRGYYRKEIEAKASEYIIRNRRNQ